MTAQQILLSLLGLTALCLAGLALTFLTRRNLRPAQFMLLALAALALPVAGPVLVIAFTPLTSPAHPSKRN